MVATDRLKLVPLTYPQLVSYLRAGNELEEALGLAKAGRTISEDVKEMVENFTLPKMEKASEAEYLFYTFWIVIDKSTNTIVAELGFKGVPDRNFTIEIGYGTMTGHTGKGYMTEAVGGIVNWAFLRDDVKCVVAETHINNLASIRIVQKNGFEQFNKKGDMLWWRKVKSEVL